MDPFFLSHINLGVSKLQDIGNEICQTIGDAHKAFLQNNTTVSILKKILKNGYYIFSFVFYKYCSIMD